MKKMSYYKVANELYPEMPNQESFSINLEFITESEAFDKSM